MVDSVKTAKNNGYDVLVTDVLSARWRFWYEIAERYSRKVPSEDRQDTLHDILIGLEYQERQDGVPLPEPRARKIASNKVADYWRKIYAPRDTVTLETMIQDTDGAVIELGSLIADTHTIDLDSKLDAEAIIKRCPAKVVQIAKNKLSGKRMTTSEQVYLWRWLHSHKTDV